MTDNIIVKDASSSNKTMRTTDTGGVHTPHHIPTVGGSPVASGNPMPVAPPARNCVGRQTLSVTLTPPAGAVAAMVQADGSAVSITLEGTNPTASLGMRIDDGVMFYVDTNLSNVKLIARVATTNVHVVYFDKV